MTKTNHEVITGRERRLEGLINADNYLANLVTNCLTLSGLQRKLKLMRKDKRPALELKQQRLIIRTLQDLIRNNYSRLPVLEPGYPFGKSYKASHWRAVIRTRTRSASL